MPLYGQLPNLGELETDDEEFLDDEVDDDVPMFDLSLRRPTQFRQARTAQQPTGPAAPQTNQTAAVPYRRSGGKISVTQHFIGGLVEGGRPVQLTATQTLTFSEDLIDKLLSDDLTAAQQIPVSYEAGAVVLACLDASKQAVQNC
jgi:hypothetical protein